MTSVKLTKAQYELLLKAAGGAEITRLYRERKTAARVHTSYSYSCRGETVNPKTFGALLDAGYLTYLNNPASLFAAKFYGISAKGKARANGEEI